MLRPKRDLWKVGAILIGILPLLVLLMWLPVPIVVAQQQGTLTTPITGVTVQPTPTEDATVTALNKEKLAQEVLQLKNQNEPDLFGWLRMNAGILLSTLVVVVGGLTGLWRWLGEQSREREKRAEERFHSTVAALRDDKEGARIGATILLRTFLYPGYEQFYIQTFDLAVGHLRLRSRNPNAAEPLDILSQALITVFKEAFPLVRNKLMYEASQFHPQSLDASGILLDYAYLGGETTDLGCVWMPRASLQKADLSGANLKGANLSGANLKGANLSGADLSEAKLTRSKAFGQVSEVWQANLSGADFNGADLSGANLGGANLENTTIENALTLVGTNLFGVKGLTKEQKAICKAKRAFIDEDSTTNEAQTTASPPPSEQSIDVQAPSNLPVQEKGLHPDTDGSITSSSEST